MLSAALQAPQEGFDDVPGGVGAQIFGRVPIDADGEEYGVRVAAERSADRFAVESVPFDDVDPQPRLGRQLVGRADQYGHVVPPFEGLAEALAPQGSGGAEDRDVHAKDATEA